MEFLRSRKPDNRADPEVMEQRGAEGGQSMQVGFARAELCLLKAFVYSARFPFRLLSVDCQLTPALRLFHISTVAPNQSIPAPLLQTSGLPPVLFESAPPRSNSHSPCFAHSARAHAPALHPHPAASLLSPNSRCRVGSDRFAAVRRLALVLALLFRSFAPMAKR